MGFLLNKAHHLFGSLEGPLRIVGDPQLIEHIGKTHDPETDFAVALDHPVYLGQWISGHIDRVVQETHTPPDYVLQGLIINDRIFNILNDVLGKIYGTKITGLKGQKGLFPAGIRALYLAQGRGGIIPVYPVKEDYARITVFPGLPQEGPVNFGAVRLPDLCLVPGIYQVIFAIGLDRLHKGVGYGHGDIKVVQFPVVPLAVYKIHDVRVIHPQDTHVGPPPGAALFDLLRCGIENFHKGYGA